MTAITRNYCSCFCKTQCARAVAATAAKEVVCKYLRDRSKSFWKINFKILPVFPFIVLLFSMHAKLYSFLYQNIKHLYFRKKEYSFENVINFKKLSNISLGNLVFIKNDFKIYQFILHKNFLKLLIDIEIYFKS